MSRPPLALLIPAVLLALGVLALFLFTFFPSGEPVSPYLARDAAGETGAANLVAGVYLNYRLYDTLFEVLVFAVAVIGVRYYLVGQKEGAAPPIPESPVVRTAADLLFSPLLLIGVYLVLFGHLSPGGGFAGGVVGGSGLLLCAIGLGGEVIARRFHETALERTEWLILAGFLLLLLVPVLFGAAPGTDLLPQGTVGNPVSGGTIVIYNILIGAKVFIGTWVVIYYFTRHRGEV